MGAGLPPRTADIPWGSRDFLPLGMGRGPLASVARLWIRPQPTGNYFFSGDEIFLAFIGGTAVTRTASAKIFLRGIRIVIDDENQL
jgi:hypothetical protein